MNDESVHFTKVRFMVIFILGYHLKEGNQDIWVKSIFILQKKIYLKKNLKRRDKVLIRYFKISSLITKIFLGQYMPTSLAAQQLFT